MLELKPSGSRTVGSAPVATSKPRLLSLGALHEILLSLGCHEHGYAARFAPASGRLLLDLDFIIAGQRRLLRISRHNTSAKVRAIIRTALDDGGTV